MELAFDGRQIACLHSPINVPSAFAGTVDFARLAIGGGRIERESVVEQRGAQVGIGRANREFGLQALIENLGGLVVADG